MAKTQHRSKPVSLWVWVIAGAVALSLAFGAFAFSQSQKPSPQTAAKLTEMPHHVPPEPAWLKNALQPVRTAYIYAASNPEPLKQIPCYCGCDAVGHKDNYECYFTHDGQGTVTGYEQHAYG